MHICSSVRKFGITLFGVSLALLSYSAMAVEWPPTLDPNPEVQPPKWDWQLAVPVTVNPDSSIEIYDIDMFDNESTGMVGYLHSLGKKVICYVDVGSWEDWRDDKDAFPQSLLGNTYVGFSDEKWLDIRDVNPDKSTTGMALADILEARFERARMMGCDAIEPDNMHGYEEASGFPLTYEDQIYFNLWVAEAVHIRGMLVALKNDISQAQEPRLIETFDFVVSEQCFQYNECNVFSGFLAANKPVFVAEYRRTPSDFCPDAKALRISAIKKTEPLDATREDCDAYYDSVANTPPVAAFSKTCAALDCTFTDTSSDDDGTVTAWSWNFGDGNSSTEQNASHTYAADGTYTVSLTVTDNGGATNAASQSITVTTSVEITTATFVSIAAEDGWVRESGENSDVGGARNTGAKGRNSIRMGDDKKDRQYKSILSFDTSAIPDGATIVSATLQLTRGGNKGANPFNTHGTSFVDIKNGGFGGNAALKNSDFQAAADGKQVAIITNQGGQGSIYTVDLNTGVNFINTAGRTQLRLYFSLDDNDDLGNDFAGFFSANNSNSARHPRLIVTYEE